MFTSRRHIKTQLKVPDDRLGNAVTLECTVQLA
jgi:hypothetical protein